MMIVSDYMSYSLCGARAYWLMLVFRMRVMWIVIKAQKKRYSRQLISVTQVYTQDMGGFLDFFKDVGNGLKSVGEGIYNGALKPAFNSVIKPVATAVWDRAKSTLGRFDKVNDAAVNVAQGAGTAAVGIGDFLGGKSNFLMYAGVALVGVLILPKVLDRVL
jgi:hypothetical protein